LSATDKSGWHLFQVSPTFDLFTKCLAPSLQRQLTKLSATDKSGWHLFQVAPFSGQPDLRSVHKVPGTFTAAATDKIVSNRQKWLAPFSGSQVVATKSLRSQ
jgi:hypothetical protein